MMKKKILVINDEPHFVEMIKMRLEANNYEVIMASNGKEALAKIKRDKPDSVLLDILMPKPDELEMLEKIRSKNKDLPIFMVDAASSVRRFRRVGYKAGIKILLPEGKTESAQTLDISKGGICFISKRKLEKGKDVGVKLRFPKRKETISALARVTWIKDIRALPSKTANRYKVGLVFIKLKAKEKKILSKFIKLISA